MKNRAFAVLIGLLLLMSAPAVAWGQSDGGLVLNEFMADNDGAVPGPYMTFPDWIEIYNNGNTLIDLSGMCLTEDFANVPWRFPNGTSYSPWRFPSSLGQQRLRTGYASHELLTKRGRRNLDVVGC